MAELTVSQCLGMLLEDSDSQAAFDGLLDALTSGKAERLGQDPIRLIEAARHGHVTRGESSTVAKLIEIELEVGAKDPDREASMWKELGRIRHDELLNDAGAKVAYEKALALRPGDHEVQDTLEQLAQVADNWKEIAKRFSDEAENASDPNLRTSLLVRAASLIWQYKKRGRDKEVDALFREAIESDPSDTRAALLFEQTLRAREEWEELGKVLLGAAESAKNRDDKLNLYVRAARILRTRLNDREKAATCYERVLDFSPGHSEAMSFLVAYFTEKEEWDHLVAVYEDALRSRQKVDSEQGILLQLGMVQWRMRGRAEDAEPYFARLRKFDPAHPAMLDFYRDYLTKSGDEARLLTILGDAQRTSSDTGSKLRLAVEVARAAQDNPATLERGIDAWKAVQRLDPANMEAQTALVDLYRRAGKWNALVEALKAELEAKRDASAEERVAILREMVLVYRDRLNLDVMVINTYNAILQIMPEDEEALGSLAQTYESLGRWNDLIQVLTRQADASTDAARKVDLYTRVANLWIDRFSNFNQATRPLEQVIAIAPDNREALARLKDIYAKKRAWQPLFDVLHREAQLASDPTMRLSNLVELAKIAGERLHRNADAIGIWRQVIEEDPSVPGALDALEKLAEREKDWATFALTLETRLQQTNDSAERIKILQKLGTLYSEHVEDHALAAGAWKRVLEIEPRNGRALRTLREAFLAAGDWKGLEALYGEAGDWEGLVDVLGAAADKASDAASKVALSLRAAEVYENQIGEPARAFRAYERVLAVEPNNVHAATALIGIYEKDQKWQRLPSLLEVVLKSLPSDAPSRVGVLSRLRDLTLGELRDAESALVWALEAYQAAPDDASVRQALEGVAEKAGSWDSVVSAYVSRIATSGKKSASSASADEVLLLRRRVAQISADKLQHSDAAITQLREIVAADPGDGDATASLEKLYRAGGRHLDLRELYVARLAHATDSTTKFSILSELAKLEESNFSDTASAAARYRAMLEIDPNELDALAALDRLTTGAERWEELAEVLKRRRELVSDDRVRNEISLRLGVTLSERLNDPSGALEVFADLLGAVPGHGQAVVALEQLAERYPASSLAAGRLLESAYETNGAYDKLARVLESRLKATKDEAERRELRLRVAELSSGKLGNAAAAYTTLEAAFLDNPNDSDLWDRLAQAANSAKQHEALATAYATAIEVGSLGVSDVTELSKRTAKLYDDVLERPDAAEAFHKRVLIGEPLDETSFIALKDLYTNRERWDDLQVLYRNRIAETVDAEAKLDLLMQVCFLFEEILDDTEKAIRAYQDVLELAPEHDSARRALERLYQRTGRYRDLAALLTGDLDRSSVAERIDRLLQIGEIYEKQLREPGPAVDHFEQVLQEAPTQMRAQESLERLLPEPSQRQRVATILEPLYETQGGWADLVRILEVQLEDVRDPGSRVALLMRIAELSEQRLHATDRAFNALERAVLSEPSDAHSRSELARIAGSRGEERARASVLERAIDASESAQVQGELLLEVANLWNDPIRDAEKAEAAFERLIALDPHDADHVLAASRALQIIHMQRGDHRKLADDLRRQVRFEGDAQVRSRLLVRLGELLEGTLGDVQGAVEVHAQRLEHEPNDVDAMRSLERLHASLGQWPELVAVLRARDNVTNDDAGRREIAREIARVLEEKVVDRDSAIAAYSDMLSSFGPDKETLESLARLYEASERWSDLAEVLNMEHERLLSSGSDATSVAQVRFRSAELLRTHLHARDRAIEGYAEVLELAPQHDGAVLSLESLMATGEESEKIAAARVLLPRYEAAGLYDKLLLAFGVLAESDDPAERTRALRRAADVADVGLNDASGAFGWMARAVRAGIGEDDLAHLLREAERLASACGRWDDYVVLLRDVVGDIGDGDLQINTLARIADIAKTRLDDLTLARDYYLKVIQERPDDATALDALEEIFTTTRDPQGLLDILRKKTDLASSSDVRVRLLLRQADISETQVRDVDAAIDAYEQVLSDADPVEAYRGLERLYTKAERFTDLASLHERQIDKRVGDVIEAHYALGKLSNERLGDTSQALHHFREAVAKQANHAGAVTALEAMMQTGEHRAEAAEILEPVYLARLDWQKVIASLEARVTPDSDPDVRKKLLTRLAEYHEVQLEDIDAAVETYARVFREDPTDESTWDVLTRLTRTNNKWARLAEIYGEALAGIDTDEPATARLSMITGRLHDEKTGDLVKAGEFYHRALRFDPTDRAAFDAVESVYLRQSAQDALLSLYREQADIAPDDATRLQLLHKIASIQHELRNDPEASISAYREILDASPSDSTALRVLDARYVELNRHEDLAEHLRHRIDLGTGGDEIELKARLADLLSTHLNDKTAAIDLFEEILSKNQTHHASVVALEGLVRDEEHRLRIIQLLEPIYRKAGQWKKLVAIFEAQILLVDDSMERSRILGEIADLYEQKGRDGDLAFAAWARALAEEPASEHARAQLDRLADILGMWDSQIVAYEEAISHTQDTILIAQLLRTMAKVHDERRGDPRSAIQTYERLLQLDEADMTPFDALESLHTMVGDWPGMVDVLNRRVERSYDAVERGELLRRAGSVLEDLIQDRDGAIGAYRRALDENDSDELALDALDRLYTSGEQWEPLADILRRRVEITQEPELRAEIGVRLGQVFEQKLRQPTDAIPVLERVLDDKPHDAATLAALSRLYESQGMWPELLENLRLRAGMSGENTEKVALLARIGEVLEMETNDVSDALSAYREVLEIDRAHAPTLDALLRITKLDEYRANAAEILEPRLRELGRYDDLTLLLEQTAEGISDPIQKHAELRRIAALHEEQRSDNASAFEMLRLAFNEDPSDHATAHDLERLAATLNGWSKLAETFQGRASTVLDPNDGKRIYMRLASIHEERLGSDAQAIEAYKRAAELTGDEDDVLAALERLYQKTEQWNELSETLDRRLAASNDPSVSAELLVRLGQLKEAHFHDSRGAFEAYREVLERNPQDARAAESLERLSSERSLASEILEILERVYRDRGAMEKVAALFDKRIELAESDSERVRLLQESASLWEHDLGQPARALQALRDAFEVDPRDEAVLGDIERLAPLTGSWDALRGLAESVANRSELNRATRRDLHMRAAHWYRDHMQDNTLAEERYRSVLELDTEATDAHNELIELLRAPGREADLVKALRAHATIESDEFTKKDRYREAARVAEGSLRNVELATDSLEKLLEIDGGDAEALDALIALRAQQGSHSEVVSLLERRIEVESSPDARLALRKRVATVRGTELGDAKGAVAALREVLDESPGDPEAMQALERIFEAEGNHAELEDILQKRLDLAETPSQRTSARVRLARLVDEKFGRRADAISHLREVLAEEPSHVEGQEFLERLLIADERFDEVGDLLQQRAIDASTRGDTAGEVATLFRLAELTASKLNDPSRTASVYERVLEREPGNLQALEALLSIYRGQNDVSNVASTMERKLSVQRGSEAAHTALALADLFASELHDDARAEDAMRLAMEIEPGNAATREKLKSHYESREKYRELAEMLTHEIEAATTNAEKVAGYRRISALYAEKLGDAASAAQTLEKAAELAPEDREILLPLCDLYMNAGRQGDAVPVLQRIIASYGGKRTKEVGQFHHRLGQALEGAGDTAGALAQYDAAFKLDLTNVAILRDLGKITHAMGDYDRAQKTFRALLLQKLDASAGITKADVYFYLGDISRKQEDLPKAINMLERAIAEDKQHPRAIELLRILKG